MTEPTYYKVLGRDATSCNGGKLQWSKPRGKRPGKWHSVKGPVSLCENGFHAVTAEHVLDWSGTEVWEIELTGEIKTDSEKVVAQRARLLRLAMSEAAMRHFAVSCAARVLPIYEAKYPDDLRVRECLMACDPGSDDAARVAALAAAGTAARDAWAAWGDAGAAVWGSAAWATAWAARDAAGDAARAAAGAAARDAAWAAGDAAWAAEHRWQQRRLRQYLAGKIDISQPVRLPARPKGAP